MAAAKFGADVTRHAGPAGTGALGVHTASRKIGKPGAEQQQQRKPIVIYMVSPKVIHVEAHEFLPLVQRLTGPEAAGSGDKKSSRPSTTSCTSPSGGAGEEMKSGATSSKASRAAPPVRVKAGALNRPAGAAVSVTATRHQQAAAAASPSGHSLISPLRGAALNGGEHQSLVSPGWLHLVGDHFLSPGAVAATLGSPSASFLDIFGPLSSQQQ